MNDEIKPGDLFEHVWSSWDFLYPRRHELVLPRHFMLAATENKITAALNIDINGDVYVWTDENYDWYTTEKFWIKYE